MTGVSYGGEAQALPAANGTAEIRGFKWRDDDGNGKWDVGEVGLPGVTIYLDLNDNGQLDDGEPAAVTAVDDPTTPSNEAGAYAFTGLEAGSYIVREVLPGGYVQTAPTPANTGFNLEVDFPDNTLTPLQQSFFVEAAARWEQIIRGDIPDVFVPGFGDVDDIVISARGPFIDGPGGILGQAGPTVLRTGSFLPARGIMEFDQADIAQLIAAGQFDEVILHEMGHVLGIGTIWRNLGLLQGFGTNNARFTGAQATAEYNAIFGNTQTSVPVESDQGGAGTLYSHWDEATFFNELMTGFLNGGIPNPISRITVGQMADLGYEVDLNAADAYTPPGIAAALTIPGAQPVEGRVIALELPRQMVAVLSRATLPAIAEPNQGFWEVTLAAGESAVDVNFGNKPLPSSIAGVVWNDANGDGVRDPGEPGLSGWTVFLDDNGNGAL
ncbi:MAG TPA: SdrD B-like domain-containing protein, partial [Lacipirellulaceae bacterium]|nr:SdrD B-like domain-containing protein [Lacipirellulaceae bacterium]